MIVNIALSCKLCFGCVLKLFMCTFNASEVTFIHFYLNGGLYAVWENRLNGCQVLGGSVFKNRSRTEFRFSAHP